MLNFFAEDNLTFGFLTGFFLHSTIVTWKRFASNVIIFCLNLFKNLDAFQKKHPDETIRGFLLWIWNRFLLIRLGLLHSSIFLAGFQVLLLAAEELIEDDSSEKLSKSELIWTCTIMISATVVKLALWIYCKSSKNDIVRAYAKVSYLYFYILKLLSYVLSF